MLTNNSNGECLACSSKSLFVNGECVNKQISLCKTYETTNEICIECNDGYYLDNDTYSCMNCPSHCKQCSKTNEGIECNEWQEEYINEHGECKENDEEKCI